MANVISVEAVLIIAGALTLVAGGDRLPRAVGPQGDDGDSGRIRVVPADPDATAHAGTDSEPAAATPESPSPRPS